MQKYRSRVSKPTRAGMAEPEVRMMLIVTIVWETVCRTLMVDKENVLAIQVGVRRI